MILILCMYINLTVPSLLGQKSVEAIHHRYHHRYAFFKAMINRKLYVNKKFYEIKRVFLHEEYLFAIEKNY